MDPVVIDDTKCINCFKGEMFYVCNDVLTEIGGLYVRKKISQREAFIGTGGTRITANHVHCLDCYRTLDVQSHSLHFTSQVDMYFPDKNCDDLKKWTHSL